MHVSFIYSSVDGNLSCFPLLATVNCAAMNMYLSVFLNCIPGASEKVLLNKYWLKE